MKITKKHWKVGELAKQTGLTVRTLHHYDQIGLFSPSQYSDTGHRLYAEMDIVKLQQILSLKQLGFSLDEIKEAMENPNFDPIKVIKMQLESVKEHIRLQEELRSRLEGIYKLLHAQQEVKTEQFIKLIEVIQMSVEKYFTQAQLEEMKNQTAQWSPEKRQQIENEWKELIANVQEEMKKNTPPESPTAVKLAKRWKELTNMFTGGDMEIVQAAERFHAENAGNALQYGVDKELYQYIKTAMAHI
ncbi:MerR family transcriptional regulator [Shimazuella sp. AN120528]|uniref:MerR family transcriptional regulator n=1 Tax=Shimazuella soli TaxID=1892854 RepID=UPI001F0E43D7|nr:MerR family transcriptional regulator [Shimazuella soli]MCH5585339.1 MerR family transcriptional regulator [Shimazuella soli]